MDWFGGSLSSGPESHGILIAAVITSAAAVLTSLSVLLRDWNTNGRRLRRLDEAKKRIAFWDAARKALPKGASGEEDREFSLRVAKNITQAAGEVEQFCSPPKLSEFELGQIDREAKYSAPRRWLYLYKPVDRSSWKTRINYYVSVLAALFVLVSHTVDVRHHVQNSRATIRSTSDQVSKKAELAELNQFTEKEGNTFLIELLYFMAVIAFTRFVAETNE